MSRMFSAWSGGPSSRPAAEAGGGGPSVPWAAPRPEPAPVAADGFISTTIDTPFIEVGDPAGAVFSSGPAVVKFPPLPAPAPAPAPAAKPVAVAKAEPVLKAEPAPKVEPAAKPDPRPFPRLATAPPYLSVSFHDLSGRVRTPESSDGPDLTLVAFHHPDHPISGEYRVLRDEVKAQFPDHGPRVLFFTAAAGESGTTTVALNLAVTLARETAGRVLVVDANVTRPGVARMMGLKPAPGLVEVLGHEVPLAWAAQPTAVPNLQVLPAGGNPAAPPAGMADDLPRLAEQLRQWYDWVLIDAGVWGVLPDRDSACPAADAVYLVAREAAVDRSEFAGLRGWVKELGGLLRGYVTTRA
ncbi:MAG TPA: CpsD/CapB family tyrosine-protein kinase [Urbifossiella sp.]|nr:CpsD/CapB family tyrosine-protein kinase [Urbifossiella sp.]